MTIPRLSASGLTLSYGDNQVVHDLDLVIPEGKITSIVGSNGCGKSTLLRGLARLMKPKAGQVILNGKSISTLPSKEVARVLGLLPQSPLSPEGITVWDLVGRGRHPHQGTFARWSEADSRAVSQALAVTSITDLAGRHVDELSGGQRQRVWIAMVLAQETGILLLDEPTTFLDVAHQVDVLELLADLNKDRGSTIVMVLHDLNMAARYSDQLVAMKDGAIYQVGSPEEVVTRKTVEAVFGLECAIIPDPVFGGPLVVPLGRPRDSQGGPRGSVTTASGSVPTEGRGRFDNQGT